MARQNERNTTSEFSRRDILSTAVIAGGVLTGASASIAQSADKAPKIGPRRQSLQCYENE
jgi:hypothetical protein